MELSDFIAKTLVDIQTGVQKAINQTGERGIKGAINPVWGSASEAGRNDVQTVSFDIAVYASESENKNIDGGIRVVGIKAGGEAGKASEISNTSRIQFSIPILPTVHVLNFVNGDTEQT